MHQRQAIREAVVARLIAAGTAAEARVFPTREAPWRRIELPGIAVYSLEESKEPAKRRVKIAILLVVALTAGVDDAMDALCLEVETAMAADVTLGGLALASSYTGMEAEVSEDQGVPIGAMRLTYEVWYL